MLQNDNEELTSSEEKARSLYTAEAAALNIAAIAGYARNYLPLLFNLFIQSPSEKRGDLQVMNGQVRLMCSLSWMTESCVT